LQMRRLVIRRNTLKSWRRGRLEAIREERV